MARKEKGVPVHDTDSEFWGIVAAGDDGSGWFELREGDAAAYVTGCMANAFVAAGGLSGRSPEMPGLALLLQELGCGHLAGVAVDSGGRVVPIPA